MSYSITKVHCWVPFLSCSFLIRNIVMLTFCVAFGYLAKWLFIGLMIGGGIGVCGIFFLFVWCKCKPKEGGEYNFFVSVSKCFRLFSCHLQLWNGAKIPHLEW